MTPIATAVSEFGHVVADRFATGGGEPEDLLRGPLEQLIEKLAAGEEVGAEGRGLRRCCAARPGARGPGRTMTMAGHRTIVRYRVKPSEAEHNEELVRAV